MTEDQLRAKIIRYASRPDGSSREAIRKCVRQPNRDRIVACMDAMIERGEIAQVLKPTLGLPQRRVFECHKRAQAWLRAQPVPTRVGLGRTARKAAPKPTLVGRQLRYESTPQGPVVGAVPAPTVCPSGLDFRYTVHELPPGYVSTLNPSECRPWANVAAQARTGA